MRRALIGLLMLALAGAAAQASDAPLLAATIHSAAGKPIPLAFELATTPEQRARGLMHRQTLAPADGMAFFFAKPARQKFWMKNTPLPLDMLFVDASRRIVYIGHGIPLSEEPVGPAGKVLAVFEIAGGRAAKEGIRVGDTIEYVPPAEVVAD